MDKTFLSCASKGFCLPGWARVMRPINKGDIVLLRTPTKEDIAMAELFRAWADQIEEIG